MLLADVARTSADVAAASARLAKIALIADLLRKSRPHEGAVVVSYLSGVLPQGTVGVGWAALRQLPPPAAPPPDLEILEVDASLERLKATTGPGSIASRRDLLSALFARATEEEQRFLVALLLGELRQGALEGVMVEAVARAAAVPAPQIRRAAMMAGDLPVVAAAALAGGAEALAGFQLQVLRPIQPMLAQSAANLGDAMGRIAPAAVEWKLDGARVQVHRDGSEVRVFTRTLAEATARVPEVVERVMALPVRAVVLDGEAVALRGEGRPRTFQETMSRFGTQVEDSASATTLSAFFFDCLHLDGEDLIDRPGTERIEALRACVPVELRVPREEAADVAEAAPVLEEALRLGHEGVMVKGLDTPYEAGRRGAAWLKVKVAHTLDLVVLAAEWGHGRRRGWLSNLHLGARDPETGGFVMLGKTFKGMTDAMLTWQTEHLLSLETERDAYTVYVRPELVVEVAFDGVQRSPRYPGGIALRFARVKGYRPDKHPADADTIETVRAFAGA
jgi:ATP-dependent DNA ligase I